MRKFTNLHKSKMAAHKTSEHINIIVLLCIPLNHIKYIDLLVIMHQSGRSFSFPKGLVDSNHSLKDRKYARLKRATKSFYLEDIYQCRQAGTIAVNLGMLKCIHVFYELNK